MLGIRRGVWVAVAAALVAAVGLGFLAGTRMGTRDKAGGARHVGTGTAAGADTAPVAPHDDVAPVSLFQAGPVAESASGRGESPADPANLANLEDWGDLLIEKLVDADLRLSEASSAAQRAETFCAMSKEVLAEIRVLLARRQPAAAAELGRGYSRLLREGALPNISEASVQEDRDALSRIGDSLRWDIEAIGALAEKAEGTTPFLADALAASNECRKATELMLSAPGGTAPKAF